MTRVEVVLTNRGTREAEAFVREGVEQFADNQWKVLESSSEAERLGANSLQFRVRVPAGGQTTVTYEVAGYSAVPAWHFKATGTFTTRR